LNLETLSLHYTKESLIKFPLPLIETSFNACVDCKFCCQWCEHITPKGCNAPAEYDLLPLCKAFPILIGPSEGINPSIGLYEEQYPQEFGAFVPLGNHCLSAQDEKQRIVFQEAAGYLNKGYREFTIYYEEEKYYILINVKDPLKTKLIEV
jgi:hypothetical protein